MNNPTAYPLAWPKSVPRCRAPQQSRFRKQYRSTQPGTYSSGGRRHTFAEARRFLSDELDRLGARECVISTDVPLKANGEARGGFGQPADRGVAVYFKLKGKQIVLPCDKWMHIECNVYAIAKHIEALRGQDRWGVGSVEQAFAGYLALEVQTQPKWFETLGVAENATIQQIDCNRKNLLRIYHPDGSAPDPVKFSQIGEAYRIAMEIKRS